MVSFSGHLSMVGPDMPLVLAGRIFVTLASLFYGLQITLANRTTTSRSRSPMGDADSAGILGCSVAIPTFEDPFAECSAIRLCEVLWILLSRQIFRHRCVLSVYFGFLVLADGIMLC